MKKFIYDSNILGQKHDSAISILGKLSDELSATKDTIAEIDEEIKSHENITNLQYFEDVSNNIQNVINNIEVGGYWYRSYKLLTSIAEEYYSEVESKFKGEIESILTDILNKSVEDKLTVGNSIGAKYDKWHRFGDSTIEEKEGMGFEDLLSYGSISKAVNYEYENHRIKTMSESQGHETGGSLEEFRDSIEGKGDVDYKTYLRKELESAGKFTVDFSKQVVSMVLDFTDVVGDIKGAVEAAMGKNYITGEEVSGFDRGLSAGSAIPLLGKGADVKKLIKGFDKLNDLSKASDVIKFKNVDEIVNFKNIENIDNVDDIIKSSDVNLSGIAEKVADPKVIYGELDLLGRPTGINATITSDMIGTGSSASSSIKPPGFLGSGEGHARGHLFGSN